MLVPAAGDVQEMDDGGGGWRLLRGCRTEAMILFTLMLVVGSAREIWGQCVLFSVLFKNFSTDRPSDRSFLSLENCLRSRLVSIPSYFSLLLSSTMANTCPSLVTKTDRSYYSVCLESNTANESG